MWGLSLVRVCEWVLGVCGCGGMWWDVVGVTCMEIIIGVGVVCVGIHDRWWECLKCVWRLSL